MQRFIPQFSVVTGLMLMLMLTGPSSGPILVAEARTDDAAAAATLSCGLAQVAFCDTFTTRYTGGGRTGELDPSRWSVSRLSNFLNPSQGELNVWPVTSLPICDHNIGNIGPSNDVKVCTPDPGEDPYFDEQFNDAGGLVLNAFRPRPAFDFTGRSGTIVFDLDAKTGGSHGFWTELWISDQPVPTAGGPGAASLPRNALNLQFSGCFVESGNKPVGGVAYMTVVNNWSPTVLSAGNSFPFTCYATADGKRNHFEVHLSQDTVEVWATDPESTNLRKVASRSGLNLPFSRGYVIFEHVHYNPEKEGLSGQQHYEWANVGFDGPTLTARGYDVPDALVKRPNGSVDLGYVVHSGAQPGLPAFVLHGVDLTGATDAVLNLNIALNYSPTTRLSYRLNGVAWRPVPFPFPKPMWDWRALSVPVELGDLKPGDNTLEFAAGESIAITNVDVTVNVAGTSAAATPIPTAAAVDTQPPTPTATPEPAMIDAPPAPAPDTEMAPPEGTPADEPAPPDVPPPDAEG